MIINVEWQGSLSVEDTRNLDGPSDYGIYQLCGRHPVYRGNTLLYIGKAWNQTLGARVSQYSLENWVCGTAAIHVGRLAFYGAQPTDWEERVNRVEALLIYSHAPAWNSQCINDYGDIGDLHILNWGDYGLLLPEVSTARYQYSHNRLPDHLNLYTDE